MMTSFVAKFSPYGAVVAIGLQWLAVTYFYLVLPAYFSGQYTLSYFATFPQTGFVFSVCFALSAISFWLFVKYHLRLRYRTPVVLFGLAMASLGAVALYCFNFDDSLSLGLHNGFALLFGAALVAALLVMAAHNRDKWLRRLSLATGCVIVGCMTLLVLLLAQPQDSRYALPLELGAGLAYQAWMAGVTWLVLRRQPTTVIS